LPAQAHIRGGTGPHRRRPCFGDERHSDPELPAEAEARERAIEQKIVITAGDPAQAGEHGEYDDRIGQHAHPPDFVGQDAEQDAARDRADQRRRHERSALRRCEREIGRDRLKHKAQDQEIEAVHRVAERGSDQCLDGFAVDRGGPRRFDHVRGRSIGINHRGALSSTVIP
jgi:hypothetical protein